MTATTNATTSSDSQSHFYSPPVAPTQEIILPAAKPAAKSTQLRWPKTFTDPTFIVNKRRS